MSPNIDQADSLPPLAHRDALEENRLLRAGLVQAMRIASVSAVEIRWQGPSPLPPRVEIENADGVTRFVLVKRDCGS